MASRVFQSRSKRVELDIHYMHDKVLAKTVDVCYVPSFDQLVDGLRKPLSKSKFSTLKQKLGVLPSPSRLRGDVRTEDPNGVV